MQQATLKKNDKQVDSEVALNLAILEERDREFKAIQQDIKEVSEMYAQVNELIHDQGQQIDTIEHNITKTTQNVNVGVKELKKAEQSSNSCILL